MSARQYATKVVQNGRFGKPLLKPSSNQWLVAVRHGGILSRIKTPVPFYKTPPMYHPTALKEHYGVIPVLVIAAVGMTCELLWTIRLALTRDDVRYCKRSPYPFEYVEMREGVKYPRRKFSGDKEKYIMPQGVIDGYRDPTEEEEKEMERKRREKEREERNAQRFFIWRWICNMMGW